MLIDSYFRCLNCYWHEICRHFLSFFIKDRIFIWFPTNCYWIVGIQPSVHYQSNSLSPALKSDSSPFWSISLQDREKVVFKKRVGSLFVSVQISDGAREDLTASGRLIQTGSSWTLCGKSLYASQQQTSTLLTNPHLGKVEVSGKVQLHAPIVKTISL